MTWKDRYLQASFRGVEFYVKQHETTGGRRVANHEYPNRDENYTEDMGKRTKDYEIMAYVLEPDYFQKRDDLAAALDESGAAELVHPYLGSKSVRCTGYRIREESSNGGIAEFSITFIDSGIQIQPEASIDAGSFLLQQRDSIFEFATNNLLENLIVTGVPDFVRDGARETVQQFADIARSVQESGIFTTTLSTQDLINTSANFSNNILKLLNIDNAAISDVLTLADDIISIVTDSNILAPTEADSVNILNQYQGLVISERDETTISIKAENQNKIAIKDFVDYISLAQQSIDVEATEYASYEDAIAARSSYVDKLDEKLAEAEDTIFDLLRTMRSEIIRAVPPSDESLPRIDNIQLKQPENSLVVAYRLYGDASREIEIVTRNKIRHPGFLPVLEPLEVLTDA